MSLIPNSTHNRSRAGRRVVQLVCSWLALFLLGCMVFPTTALAATPGFPEDVIQWGVQSGESCDDIAVAVYGSKKHVGLLLRYNRISCTRGAPLKKGMTLVLPAKVTTTPTARITSVNPQTRAQRAGATWSPAFAGQPLAKNSKVNTLSQGRASIQFSDRTRIFMASDTLVIIYGTANKSAVGKSDPALVELDSGELQAGLAALRGDESVRIKIKGGGTVDANSRDAVVERKGARTTVSVFDGRANVKSGGRTVKVPKNFGTRYKGNTAPMKPRALPPAPNWKSALPPVVFTSNDKGVLAATWSTIAKAKAYRFEVSRNKEFSDLVVRQEIPAKVQSFRAENMPSGPYFVRVRAIDTEDFLGIASPVLRLQIVNAKWSRGSGSITDLAVQPNRYAILNLEPSDLVEFALDLGPFGPMPKSLDFQRMSPTAIRVRLKGTEAERRYDVLYREAKPELTLGEPDADGNVPIEVTITNVDNVDLPGVVKPTVRLTSGGVSQDVPLTSKGDRFVGQIPASKSKVPNLRVDVVDGSGVVLGGQEYRYQSGDVATELGEPKRIPYPHIGPSLPSQGYSPQINYMPWVPTARNSASFSGVMDSGEAGESVGAQGQLHAMGHIEGLGLEALIRTRSFGSELLGDTSGWAGIRYRFTRIERSELEFAPGLRIGFPLDDTGPSPQLEPSAALAGASGDFQWLVNLGARVRLQDSLSRRYVDPLQLVAVGGTSYDFSQYVRFNSLLDLHLLLGGEAELFRGGLSLGMEVGSFFFASGALRASPWNDVGGHLTGQLGLGLREF